MSSFIPLGGAVALLLLAAFVRMPSIGSLRSPTSPPKKVEGGTD
ncbi:MAG TPA: hypothetical protein PLB97_08155 [Accumulibacter sp.]|jgi:hypothetical protein|nr:hypothetical protein [Accumulibacter sp.]